MATDEEVRAANQHGIAFAREGRFEEAAAWFRHAILLRPDASAGHNNLGNILTFQGQLAEAVPCYRTALKLLPDDPPTLNNLGNALRQLGEVGEAIACGRRAVALQPDYTQAHTNLGIALMAQGGLAEALTHCQTAIQLQPDLPEAHNNLGAVLVQLQRWEEAAASFREALRFRPDMIEAHIGLANACWRLDLLDEAKRHADETLRLRPNFAAGYNVMGSILFKKGRFDEARARFDQALRLQPGLAEAHFNRAQLWLQRGEFQEGWREYTWRWKCKSFVVRASERPFWDGSSLAGKSILLCAEQGLGDTLQFIRYAPLVKQQAAKAIVACQRVLIPILGRCAGIDELVAQEGDLPECDTHVPLLHLPHLLHTTLDTIPRQVPYLFADEGLVQRWRRELAAFPGFKVGIAWQGGSLHPFDRTRSIPLAQFAPLAQEGVHLISLQKDKGTEQLEEIAGRFAVIDLGHRLDQQSGAFMDTAAIMKSLDLVITTDTATAHLAGGLGVPAWVALPFVSDWRWLLGRNDSPWYPTMRLFRQSEPGKWEDVFEAIASALSRSVAETPRRLSIWAEIAAGELIDKITILEIKRERITDSAKVANITTELESLTATRDRIIKASPELDALAGELKKANAALWDIEDAIRACEHGQDFGPKFIELARSVYRENDRRADLKRQINEVLGSKLMEEKSYSQGGKQ